MRERPLSIILLLEAHPQMGRVTSLRHIRRFPLGNYPYLIDYSIEGDEIVVRRFRHTSRRPLS
jgi:plasmid stabilization system protein ParE